MLVRGLNLDDPVLDVTVFTKNRERLIEGEVAEQLLLAVVELARVNQLLSEEHFTLGADKSYQQERFVNQLRARRVQPHVAEYAPNPK